MADILSAKLVDAISMPTSSPATMPTDNVIKRREVSELDAEAFSRLLAGPPVAGAPPSASPVTVAMSSVSAVDAPAKPLLGDAVLNSLQKVGADVRNQWQKVTDLTQAHAIDSKPSISDLLNVQLQVSKVVFETEMTASVIKKSSTVIDSIVHMQ